MSLYPLLSAVALALAAVLGIGALAWARYVVEAREAEAEEQRRRDSQTMWGGEL